MEAIFAGIVLFNPEISRLKENITHILGQVDRLILVDNGSSNKEEIQSEVLAVDIKEGALEGYQKEWNINGHKVELGVEKQ